jgi:type IV secretion system protein VirB11
MSMALESADGVYLRSYLRPFAPFLEREDVTEIMVNRPGEVWIEAAGQGAMQRFEVPEIDEALIGRLASQIARAAFQGINRENPLLSAALPDGERVQIIAPPAAKYWSLAIRRHRMVDLTLSDYERGPIKAPKVVSRDDERDYARRKPIDFLKEAVRQKKTILISGGTSSGKTTFLNALLKAIPVDERIVTVEDTAEIICPH